MNDSSPAATPTDQLRALPLWAQVLTASRIVRRAAMGSNDTAAVLTLCDAVDAAAFLGDQLAIVRTAHTALRRAPLPASSRALVQAARELVDAAEGAVGAWDFPVDALVTASVERCMAAITGDPRVSGVQVAIVVHADVDVLQFACREARVGKYDSLGSHVRDRLVPVHGLALREPVPAGEEKYR